jgi:hypothetical protein
MKRLVGNGSPLRAPASALCAVADAVARHVLARRFFRFDAAERGEPVDAAGLAECFREGLVQESLLPEYDASSASWLWRTLSDEPFAGLLHGRVLRDERRAPVGWYLMYVRAGGQAEVLQIGSRPEARDAVLDTLLEDALARGACAIRGRFLPSFGARLAHRHCVLYREGPWVLVHSRDPRLTGAVHRGDAFLSRLEGEWWIRFQADLS